jgi:hypothetical protein
VKTPGVYSVLLQVSDQLSVFLIQTPITSVFLQSNPIYEETVAASRSFPAPKMQIFHDSQDTKVRSKKETFAIVYNNSLGYETVSQFLVLSAASCPSYFFFGWNWLCIS